MMVLLQHFFSTKPEFQVTSMHKVHHDDNCTQHTLPLLMAWLVKSYKVIANHFCWHVILVSVISQGIPFYIFSESYGGKMAAAISLELTKVQSLWRYWILATAHRCLKLMLTLPGDYCNTLNRNKLALHFLCLSRTWLLCTPWCMQFDMGGGLQFIPCLISKEKNSLRSHTAKKSLRGNRLAVLSSTKLQYWGELMYWNTSESWAPWGVHVRPSTVEGSEEVDHNKSGRSGEKADSQQKGQVQVQLNTDEEKHIFSSLYSIQRVARCDGMNVAETHFCPLVYMYKIYGLYIVFCFCCSSSRLCVLRRFSAHPSCRVVELPSWPFSSHVLWSHSV